MSSSTAHMIPWLLVGVTACGGLSLYLTYRLLSRVRWRKALHRIAVAEHGTAVVEFPFALITLVILTFLTWQFGFMIAGFLMVDVAAFSAARSAIVEGPAGRDALAEADEAAALALLPVAGRGRSLTARRIAGRVAVAPGGASIGAVLGRTNLDRRLAYARSNTSVSLQGAGARGGYPVTATVIHQFSLQIPFAARALGRRRGYDDYVTEIRATAILMSERYPEVEPVRRRPVAGAP